jgi:ABC-2 type transport system permease protein
MSSLTPVAPESRSLRPPGTGAGLRAVIRRGLRDHRRTVLVWGGPLSAMSALMALLWPSIEGSVDTLLDSYPESIKEAFNIRALDSIEAYIDAEMLSLIVPLALAMLAVRAVVRVLSGAEERGHLDIVLTTPVARRTLVAGAFIVAALVAAAVLALIWLVTWLAAVLVGADPSLTVLARGMANVWPLAVFFAGLAALGCGWVHAGGPVTAATAGVLVAMYLFDLLGKLTDAAEPLRYLSVFKYYGSAVQDGIDPLAFAGVTAVGIALAVAGAVAFDRRDVR